MRSEPRTNAGGYTFTPNEGSIVAEDVFPVNGNNVPWLLGQDRIWVDYWGHVHDLELMPQPYRLNVFGLLHRYAARHDTLEVLQSPLVERLHELLSHPAPAEIELVLYGDPALGKSKFVTVDDLADALDRTFSPPEEEPPTCDCDLCQPTTGPEPDPCGCDPCQCAGGCKPPRREAVVYGSRVRQALRKLGGRRGDW